MSHNSIEMLIAKAASAQKAGVFDQTSVDVSALVAPVVSSPLVRFYEKALVGLPLAACLGIVIGIGSMLGGPGGQSDSGIAGVGSLVTSQGLVDTTAELCSLESVTRCFTGPGEDIDSDCGCADLDSDGDVDLADLGTYQQMYALNN
ncbi:MAG: hypothetical protein DHS20C16_23200 [Phycisphaerae bacterium]|nr:MAG: hypothetical protein DHS20C16_23200 [Phycisphaerae bacterium]